MHLFILLMTLDIITGIVKAIKDQNLWNRKSLFGYAHKVLVLVVVVLANVIDQILDLKRMVAYATILFYIANEGLSITENLVQVGVLVPQNIVEKLKHIETGTNKIRKDVKEEFSEGGR